MQARQRQPFWVYGIKFLLGLALFDFIGTKAAETDKDNPEINPLCTSEKPFEFHYVNQENDAFYKVTISDEPFQHVWEFMSGSTVETVKDLLSIAKDKSSLAINCKLKPHEKSHTSSYTLIRQGLSVQYNGKTCDMMSIASTTTLPTNSDSCLEFFIGIALNRLTTSLKPSSFSENISAIIADPFNIFISIMCLCVSYFGIQTGIEICRDITMEAELQIIRNRYHELARLPTINQVPMDTIHALNHEKIRALEKKYRLSKRNIPARFTCMITQLIMDDPSATQYGNNFENSALTLWLQNKNIDPLVRKDITQPIVKNNKLRQQISTYLSKIEADGEAKERARWRRRIR